ncbi:MAG: FliM/FliN family flagellar motor switch protein [Armatimonadetes bacterium]|nr:FliM/FliN family flagellar motor switch protein [Armatimonadota bacterium]
MSDEKAPSAESRGAPAPRRGTLITQEELDTLADALGHLARRQASEAPVCAQVSLFDFRRPVMLSAAQLRLLRKDAGIFARALSRVLGPYLNATVRVEASSAEVTTLEAFTRNLPPLPVVAVCRLAPGSPRALWEISLPCALAAVELMLGASTSSPPGREPTAIEKVLLLRFFDELLSTWRMTSPVFSPLSPAVMEVTSSLGPLDPSQATQRVLHLRFALTLAGVSGAMNLALPVSLLRSLLDAQTASATGPGSVSTDGGSGSSLSARGGAPLASATRQVPVELSLQLPAVQVPLATLGSLKPGQTLSLGLRSDCPVVVAINGRRKFLAQSGLADGRVAVRITRVLD